MISTDSNSSSDYHDSLLPDVSIVIPVYNRSALVVDTIQTVLNQTHSNLELILVDDGSKDDTLSILEALASDFSQISVFSRDSLPKGAPKCRNIGASKARSNFIVFWDSDDYMAPWCIENRLTFMKANPQLDFSLFQLFNYDRAKHKFTFRCDTTRGNELERFLTYSTSWGTHAVIWKKSSFEKLGGWNESARTWQDGEIHVRAIADGLKFEWGSLVPDGIIVSNSSENSITASTSLLERLPNRLETLSSLLDELTIEHKRIAVKAAKARIWFETQNAGWGDIRAIAKSSRSLRFFSNWEEISFLLILGIYGFLKHVKGLRGAFYRLLVAPHFRSYKFFSEVTPDQNKLDFFRSKLIEMNPDESDIFCNFVPEPERSELMSLLDMKSRVVNSGANDK